MAKFCSPKELERYIQAYGKPANPHKAVLIDPNGQTLFEAPADQVQHYLEKGFKWLRS